MTRGSATSDSLFAYFAPDDTSSVFSYRDEERQQVQVQALRIQPRNQENVELQQQLQSSERENQRVREQMMRKEAELTRAEETIRREQQQIQEMRQRETELMQAKDRELAVAQQQLREKETELMQARDREMAELVQAKDTVAQAQEQLRKKEEQLTSSEALVADFQKNLHQRDSELKALKQKTQGLAHTSREKPQTMAFSEAPRQYGLGSRATTGSHAIRPNIPKMHEQRHKVTTGSPAATPTSPKKLIVGSCHNSLAPREMTRGSATSDSQFAYFAPDDSSSVFSYELSTREWREINCISRDGALVMIEGELTVVGGWVNLLDRTNKLFTLRQGKWFEIYPPMKTACTQPAAVSTPDGQYVVVIGGNDVGWTNSVELFQVKKRKWSGVINLPQSLPCPSAAICSTRLDVIGDNANGYSCSLQNLTFEWTSLPRLPVTRSTAATLSGQLLIVGGLQGLSEVSSICQLVEGQWVEIGSMSSSRAECLAVSPTPHNMIVVGGQGTLHSIEEFNVLL